MPVMPTLAGFRQHLLHQLSRGGLMIGALRLDQRDGARQYRPFAGTDAGGKLCHVRGSSRGLGTPRHGG